MTDTVGMARGIITNIEEGIAAPLYNITNSREYRSCNKESIDCNIQHSNCVLYVLTLLAEKKMKSD